MEPQSNHETPKQSPGTPTLGQPPEHPAWTPRAQETWMSDREMGGVNSGFDEVKETAQGTPESDLAARTVMGQSGKVGIWKVHEITLHQCSRSFFFFFPSSFPRI